MPILGIETSCDETAAAIVGSDGRVHANIIASQQADHAPHGGVVPEIAARRHLDHIDGVINAALREAGMAMEHITAIGATAGPGLIGGLLVGSVAGKAIAFGRGIPFYAINHLEAHALTARLTEAVGFPYLVLLVSGGHTQLLAVMAPGRYRIYGTTLDDAAGEAFDKSAKIMGLGVPGALPGGPAIEAAASGGDCGVYIGRLPEPLKARPGCNFSFSGMKTAIRTLWFEEIEGASGRKKKTGALAADLAASLTRAIGLHLARQSAKAMTEFRSDFADTGTPAFVVSGGVAANAAIRALLKDTTEKNGFTFHAPPPELCTDNGVMIAWAAAERMAAGLAPDGLDFDARPRWPLDDGKAA